jgi:hypothetical protein
MAMMGAVAECFTHNWCARAWPCLSGASTASRSRLSSNITQLVSPHQPGIGSGPCLKLDSKLLPGKKKPHCAAQGRGRPAGAAASSLVAAQLGARDARRRLRWPARRARAARRAPPAPPALPLRACGPPVARPAEALLLHGAGRLAGRATPSSTRCLPASFALCSSGCCCPGPMLQPGLVRALGTGPDKPSTTQLPSCQQSPAEGRSVSSDKVAVSTGQGVRVQAQTAARAAQPP